MLSRNILFCFLFSLAAALYAAEKPIISPDGFHIQTIETPRDDNGASLFFGIGGISFSEDGTAFIASRLHGVWKYKDSQWSLFADGLHDPQGIHMAKPDGRAIVVAQKPELTWIEDTSGNGIADTYRTVADDWRYAGNYCEYVHGPAVDKEGNYYLSINLAHLTPNYMAAVPELGNLKSGKYMGTTLGYDGWAAKVTPEGKFIPFAPGMRSAAGIGISPDNELFISENQGEWVATSCLYHVQEGNFYGHPVSLLDLPEYRTGDKKEKRYDPNYLKTIRTLPALWLPHGELVNSPGNPIFNTVGFGPFDGQIFMGCQTRSNIVRADLQKVKGAYQGVVFNFIDHLQSGCIRLAFSPSGELWAGQTGRGWRSKGPAAYGLQKVVWDKETIPFEIKTIKLTRNGYRVAFTSPADFAALSDQDIAVSHWTYNYSEEYGSPKVDEQSEEPQIIKKSTDGHTFEFKVPLQKERLYKITLNVKSASGKPPSVATGYYTLNNLID